MVGSGWRGVSTHQSLASESNTTSAAGTTHTCSVVIRVVSLALLVLGSMQKIKQLMRLNQCCKLGVVFLPGSVICTGSHCQHLNGCHYELPARGHERHAFKFPDLAPKRCQIGRPSRPTHADRRAGGAERRATPHSTPQIIVGGLTARPGFVSRVARPLAPASQHIGVVQLVIQSLLTPPRQRELRPINPGPAPPHQRTNVAGHQHIPLDQGMGSIGRREPL